MSAEDRRSLVRRVLTPLALALPALVVAFSVVMAGFLFAESLGDAVATRALRWAGFVLLMLFAVVGTLLVGILGLIALTERNLAAGNPPRARQPEDEAAACPLEASEKSLPEPPLRS